jgi:hypothetical protein
MDNDDIYTWDDRVADMLEAEKPAEEDCACHWDKAAHKRIPTPGCVPHGVPRWSERKRKPVSREAADAAQEAANPTFPGSIHPGPIEALLTMPSCAATAPFPGSIHPCPIEATWLGEKTPRSKNVQA